jgi:hypothetical protein
LHLNYNNRKTTEDEGMKPLHIIGLLFSHGAVFAVGFALGIYLLPILIEPEAPPVEQINAAAESHQYQGTFVRALEDSDALHWGEGDITIGEQTVSFVGELAPGPDYKLYFSPEFVETEADFARLKSQMVKVGSIKNFDRFLLDIPAGINPADYTAAIVWCETFGEFITAANYARK